MRLETALNASREGLQAHGTAISVVGDNISNVSTVAHKRARSEFAALVSEGPSGARSTPIESSGNGVQISQVRTLFEQGTIEQTGRQLDVAIAGNGFFMVGDATAPTYTRSGVFAVNANGDLVDGSGQSVLGTVPGGADLGAISLTNVELTGTPSTNIQLLGNVDATQQITTLPTNVATYTDLAGANFANSVTAYDSLGDAHTIDIFYFKTAANTWSAQAYIDGGDVGQTAGAPALVGSATLNYSTTGAIEDANVAAAQLAGTAAYSNGAAAGTFTIDLSGMSQVATPSSTDSIVNDGQAVGQIQNFAISEFGDVQAVLTSGERLSLGTIQLANFNNINGLNRSGGGGYTAGGTVGTETRDIPGSSGLGTLEGGALERANVDISNEFVELVVFQRGYQANSQTLNAANNLIRDTINLLR